MIQKRNGLYLLILAACAAGYICMALAYQNSIALHKRNAGICLFKHVTHIPCPSCGSTRAILLLMNSDVKGSVLVNPFGVLLVFIMVISPLWIIYDLLKRDETFFRFYKQAELTLQRRMVAFPAIALVLGNWIWNIYKGL